MITVVIHHDPDQLPLVADDLVPVQIYGQDGLRRGDISAIGNPVIEPIKRLGVQISPIVMDFMTIALATIAADTFVPRTRAADGWTREISLEVSLCNPDIWNDMCGNIEKALSFLSGDLWKLTLRGGGYKPPKPYRRQDGYKLNTIEGLDSVCLFSGGLDSTIGAIDLLSDGRKPLLVSHAYKGDKSLQDTIAGHLDGTFSRFAVNANPLSPGREKDITMRTRSIGFLAFAIVGCDAISKINKLENVELFMPENGFISLNVPLTSRRIGSFSTRTTHPHFQKSIQRILNAGDIRAKIINPYQFKTKGEMIKECSNKDVLQSVLPYTVSCSNWHRKNKQCGRCVPCLIRRAAVFAGGLTEPNEYLYQDLSAVVRNENRRDDLLAIMSAISQLGSKPIGPWVSESGPLPTDIATRESYKQIFERGLREVEAYLQEEGLL